MFVTKALCIQFPSVWILAKYQKCICWTACPRLLGWSRAFAPEGMDNIITQWNKYHKGRVTVLKKKQYKYVFLIVQYTNWQN